MPDSIPLFDSAKLAENLQKLGPEAVAAIQTELTAFVLANRDAARRLSEDTVKAVLFKAKFDEVQLPPLSADPSIEEIAGREAILAVRDGIFEIVAVSQRDYSTLTAELYAKARAAGAKITSVLLGLGFTAILGG